MPARVDSPEPEMHPRTLIDTARIPGGDLLRLFERGGDYMIVLDRNELMNSRMSGSEEALAVMTVDRLPRNAAPNVLIGGYGMGFTLRAALAALPPGARVTVAELVPAIIDWARGPMVEMTGDCLDDPRVLVMFEDVATVMGQADEHYDAILLDVDNGPDGLSRPQNDRLYSLAGIAKTKAALKPGGVVAIWSAGPDPQFARRLKTSGLSVEEKIVRARSNGKGPRHTIWFATKN